MEKLIYILIIVLISFLAAVINAGILQLVWNNILVDNIMSFKLIDYADCFILSGIVTLGAMINALTKGGNKCDN